MATRKKYLKKNTKKRRRLNRKTNKKLKKTKRNKIYFGGNGGTWLVSSQLEDKDAVCPICHEKFSDTPEKAIYKTVCGHLFHNNCLAQVCEHKYQEYLDTHIQTNLPVCPMCRELLDKDRNYQCMDVAGFKDKLFDDATINKYLSKEVKEIYEAQPDE